MQNQFIDIFQEVVKSWRSIGSHDSRSDRFLIRRSQSFQPLFYHLISGKFGAIKLGTHFDSDESRQAGEYSRNIRSAYMRIKSDWLARRVSYPEYTHPFKQAMLGFQKRDYLPPNEWADLLCHVVAASLLYYGLSQIEIPPTHIVLGILDNTDKVKDASIYMLDDFKKMHDNNERTLKKSKIPEILEFYNNRHINKEGWSDKTNSYQATFILKDFREKGIKPLPKEGVIRRNIGLLKKAGFIPGKEKNPFK